MIVAAKSRENYTRAPSSAAESRLSRTADAECNERRTYPSFEIFFFVSFFFCLFFAARHAEDIEGCERCADTLKTFIVATNNIIGLLFFVW